MEEIPSRNDHAVIANKEIIDLLQVQGVRWLGASPDRWMHIRQVFIRSALHQAN
jgi:hypothetical protein